MNATESQACDLRCYMEQALDTHYNKIAILKSSQDSKVTVFAHKNSGQNVLLRQSKNRNDSVYRTLRGKQLCNLPMILEVCSDEACLLVLEEYIVGQTLERILKGGLLTGKQAAQYTIDLCNGLEEMHNLGIVHRDIKPSNVMITPENKAILLDFSIAREISSDEQDTRNLGTIGYAAPEQFGVTQSGRATDLYALGVLLNTMITGTHPAVDIPQGPIRRIVQKATNTQISRRYRSAAAMAHALRPYAR